MPNDPTNKLPSTISQWYTQLPTTIRQKTLDIRQLIIHCARQQFDDAGLLEELKWSMPSFRIDDFKGTPIRLGYDATHQQFGLYVHCQTSVMTHYLVLEPEKVRANGNRGILFSADAPLPQGDINQFTLACFNYRR